MHRTAGAVDDLFLMNGFSHITVLGGGLLGGSIALSPTLSGRVRIWSRREEVTHAAQARGMQATSDLSEAVRDSQLLILCVPVGRMAELLQRAVDAGLPQSCIITDVGSVKRLPHETLRPVVQKHGLRFIGSHPMAGGEKGGIEHARSDLFDGAACLLTNEEQQPESLCQAIEHFWQELGCQTSWTSAAEHDAIVARVSHFPHVLASVGAMIGLEKPEWGAFSGGGLRDTTRVAAGNPPMWTEILLENRDLVVDLLQQASDDLLVLSRMLNNQQVDAVEAWLTEAKRRRDDLRPRS
jgi:prephenate dehydrogenase